MRLIFPSIILVVTAAMSWWISGYDPKLTGENGNADFLRRCIRCALTLFLMAVGLIGTMFNPQFAGFIAIIIAIPMVVLWMNCLGEALADMFQGLIESPSPVPESEPDKLMSDLDRLALLSRQGHTKEALKLCAKLMKNGDGSRMAIETMCFRLYGEMFEDESLRSYKSLASIQPLLQHGEYREAEARLTRMVKRNPDDLPAVYLLVRLYARNLKQAEKAGALIESLEKRSKLPPFFAAYTNHRMKEWLGPAEENGEEGIESLLVIKRI
jgi:tetratricopeptide (TPR) repeat protein